MGARRVAGLVVVSSFVLGAAHAEPVVELGGGVLVVSENGSAESGGHLGGSANVTRWDGPLGLAVEAGAHAWDGGHNKWLGVDARFALVEGRKPCPAPNSFWGAGLGTTSRTGGWPDGNAPSGPAPAPSRCTLMARLWIELGVAREMWRVGDDTGMQSVDRNRYSIGGGADLGMTRLFDTIFFRVHRAQPVRMVDRFGVDQVYETSLVFGMNLMFGR